MSIQRASLWLIAFLMILGLSRSATAQNWQPLGPVEWQGNAQPFEPADLSPYGDGPAPKHGWFGQYDRLYWSISTPKRQDIGNPLAQPIVLLPDSLDTTIFEADFGWGNRFDVGYLDDNDRGWLVSYERIGQDEDFAFQNVRVLYLTPIGGALAPTFPGFNVHQDTRFDSVEVMHIHRMLPGDRGGQWEFLLGVRYSLLDDRFRAFDQIIVPALNNEVNNHITNNLIGPQIGLRYSNIRERWRLGIEGRFLAAANFQNVDQFARTNIPAFGLTTNFNHTTHDTEFAPLGELRVDATYTVTKTVALRVGYTLTYMDGISRAANRVDYILPNYGILDANQSDSALINGVTFGIEINR